VAGQHLPDLHHLIEQHPPLGVRDVAVVLRQPESIVELERRLDAYVEKAREFSIRRRAAPLDDVARNRFGRARQLSLEVISRVAERALRPN
jgi:hypothetical protein